MKTKRSLVAYLAIIGVLITPVSIFATENIYDWSMSTVLTNSCPGPCTGPVEELPDCQTTLVTRYNCTTGTHHDECPEDTVDTKTGICADTGFQGSCRCTT